MKLLGLTASPFVAKVRMAGIVCGIDLELEPVDITKEPDDLTGRNPLGKIPVLITDDGKAVFDSTVICEVLDRMSGNQLIPQTLDGFRTTRTFEAAVTGVMEALVLCIYEVRYRPEDKRHPEWTEMQMRKADRGLKWLEDHLGDLRETPSVAHCALAALLGWMDLRYEGKAAKDAPTLKEWADRFFADQPELARVKPSLPS